jgi:hypothetical protein
VMPPPVEVLVPPSEPQRVQPAWHRLSRTANQRERVANLDRVATHLMGSIQREARAILAGD